MIEIILASLITGTLVFFIMWKRNINVTSELKFNKEKIKESENQIALLKEKAEEQNAQILNLSKSNSVLKFEVEDSKHLRERFTRDFELIARKTLEGSTKNLAQNNKQELEKSLNPFKTKISEFEKQIKDCYDKELRDKVSLKVEIEKLLNLNSKLSKDAENLTNALKGNNKVQGSWGEVILESILEKSGLKKDSEYFVQDRTKNSGEETIQPDVIIKLPEDKHVIIDAKASLKSYDSYLNAKTDEEKTRALNNHIKSLKLHVETLSKKNYQSSDKHYSLDFILMFIPIEPSYFIALQGDSNLFWEAWEKKILIVSPSTLHSTLKIIAALWKQEKQTKNVREIVKLSGTLYDKFAGYMETMHKVGRSLRIADNSYNEAILRLSTGQGNIISKLEKIKLLGAKNSKNIPLDLVENDNDNSEPDNIEQLTKPKPKTKTPKTKPKKKKAS